MMPQILIRQNDDKRLERVVPDYLRGKRKTAQRVRWAIEELIRRIADDREESKRKAG